MQQRRAVVRDRLLAGFAAAAADRGFLLDDAQRVVTHRLADLGAALPPGGRRRLRPLRGLYMFGPVGRGKTFLLDTFVAALRCPGTLRVHFHDFFDQFHRAVFRSRAAAGVSAVDAATADLLDGCRLLCFDELHVHDPGTATLLAHLLRALRRRGVPVVATSNHHPHDLLPDPLYHHLVLPAVQLIEENLDVVPLAGPLDYRTAGPGHGRAGRFGLGVYVWPAQPDRFRSLGLDPPEAAERTMLAVDGRRLHARAVRDGLVWFDFADLCEGTTSARDYLVLARWFETWVVTGLPRLAMSSPAAQQRFAYLVDVLHDRDVTLHLGAAESPAAVLGGRSSAVDLVRTASRLSLLRTLGGTT